MYVSSKKSNILLSKVWVHPGSKNIDYITETEEEQVMFESKQIMIHSDYEQKKELYFNDISLIELNRVLHFSDEIRPLCLYDGSTDDLFSDPNSDTHNSDKMQLIVAGYGNTRQFNQASFTLQNDTLCGSDDFNTDKFDSVDLDRLLCGQGLSINNSEGPNTCNGDSGGPLMVETVEFVSGEFLTKWKLVGIVSMGPKDCTDKDAYTIFSNVHDKNTTAWIHDTINANTATGTYCYQDLMPQCVKCHDTYKLENQKCDLEFSQNQMNSVYGFFNTTFCADDCPSYMKIIPSQYKKDIGDLTIKKGKDTYDLQSFASEGFYLSTYNKCQCRHGQAALRCPKENSDFCDPRGCKEYYHYNPMSKACEKNICKCDPYFYTGYEKGTLGPAKKCKIHDTQQCDCHDYYHIDDISGKCVENVCTCDQII